MSQDVKQQRPEWPEYFEPREPVWIKCEDSQELGPTEVACIIGLADGDSRLVFVQPHHFDYERGLVFGKKAAAWPDDTSQWLVDIQTGRQFERMWISDEKIARDRAV